MRANASSTSNMAELLFAAPNPDALSLVDRSQNPPVEVTAADLQARALRLAGGLIRLGLQRGARIGILAGNTGAYYDVMFGAPAGGFVTVPLNTRLPLETQQFIVGDADLELIFVDEQHLDRAPQSVRRIVLGSAEWQDLVAGPPIDSPVAIAPDDVAVQLYTSGSTGRPKGVLLTHENITWTVTEYGAAMPGEVMLVSAPLYHKNASMGSKLAFATGGTVVLLPEFTAAGYLDAIEAHGVTMCSGVPTMYALVTAEMAHSDRTWDISSVQRALVGSAPMTEALFDDVQRLFPDAFITNGYGTTEAVLEFGPHPEDAPRPKITLGYQHSKVELRLVDPDSGEDGDRGELWVRSPGVMPGYHNLPEVNAERLVDGWYRTGDLMSRDPDGWYFFVGRVDDMFVCAGENIYPDAVEQMLERHPAVHQAVVVPVPDELKGRLPASFIRVEPGATLTVDEVKQFALTHGPAYAHPRHVWFVDEILLASTAKIDRNALTADAAARLADQQDGD
ncbi:MAG: long-chain acyl-CoA synthetase [Candidatus Poriferisodalaceae bacterium]|jgi:long-chain acyl-CoA synthetase